MVAPHGFTDRYKGKRAFPWLGLYQGGGQAVAVFWNAGAPTSGPTGTLANIANPGALLATAEPALYQNTNSLISPTWTATSVAGANTVTNLVSTGYIAESVAPAVTTGVALSEFQLVAQFNRITTNSATTKGVILPLVSAVGVGAGVWVANDTANSCHVLGAGSDTVDGQVAATGVVLGNGKMAMYLATAAATYISFMFAIARSA